MTSDSASVDRKLFRHVILTRFSVRFTAEQPPPEDDWLRYRFGFFEQAAAASVRTQTTRPDHWLVFCDADSPDWLREQLPALGAGLFKVVWLEEPWGHAPLRRAVAEVADRPYLITTRFDSDDALGKRFVSLVQSQFAGQGQMYVNLLRGLQVDRSGQVFRCDYWQNAFISLIERLDGQPRTVFQSFHHPSSRKLAPVRNVVTDPAWVQVIHGGNLANLILGPRVSPELVRETVDMELDYDTETHGARLAAQWLASWPRLAAHCARHPGLARTYLEGQRFLHRGTTTLDKIPG
jgi:hypothetical protein